MTEKTLQNHISHDTTKGTKNQPHERQTGQFCTVPHTGIVVDMEVQTGDPVDSQIIRNFIGEFEQACKKQSL